MEILTDTETDYKYAEPCARTQPPEGSYKAAQVIAAGLDLTHKAGDVARIVRWSLQNTRQDISLREPFETEAGGVLFYVRKLALCADLQVGAITQCPKPFDIRHVGIAAQVTALKAARAASACYSLAILPSACTVSRQDWQLLAARECNATMSALASTACFFDTSLGEIAVAQFL